jgi:hypothetical protein
MSLSLFLCLFETFHGRKLEVKKEERQQPYHFIMTLNGRKEDALERRNFH